MGRCSQFVDQKWGFPTESVPHVVVLNAVAAVEVLPQDPNRMQYTVMNLGAANCNVAWSSAVGALFGFFLGAASGVMNADADVNGELVTYPLYGLGTGATTLYIVETRAVR